MRTPAEITHYLIRRGFLSAADVINGDLEILEISRKNNNFAVMRERGASYLLKLANPGERHAGVSHEAYVYSFLQDHSFPWAPRLIDYDSQHGLLILELVANGVDMHAYQERKLEVSRTISASLGRALAALHSLEPAPTLPLRRPWPVAAFRPHVQMLRELSPASLEVIKVLQQSPDAAESFAAVGETWRDTSVIHFDMKWPNVVVAPGPGSRRVTRAWLVDWELAWPR